MVAETNTGVADVPEGHAWEKHSRDGIRRRLIYTLLLATWLLVVMTLAPNALADAVERPSITVVGFLVGMASVLPHEGLHAAVFELRGYPSKIVWKGLTRWKDAWVVSPNQSVDRTTILMVLVAPFVVLNSVGIVILYAQANQLLTIAGVWILFFNITRSSTDWYDIVQFIKLSPQSRIGYRKCDGEWHLLTSTLPGDGR